MLEKSAGPTLQTIVLAAACLLGCSEPPAPQYRVLVRVESDPGVPLAGAVVRQDATPLGTTDARGELLVSLRGPAGSQVALQVQCPSGSREARQLLAVALRPWTDPSRRPEYLASCRPELRNVVIAVRAQNGPNLPLRYLGREIARTDASGAAHGLLQLAPNQAAKLVLDTSAPEHRSLRPRNPELKLTVPDCDDVVLFDQPFVVDAPKRPAPRVVLPELPRRF
ncbi:MAG TPA: hypothetical protein VJR89_21285 [Polyangiales bacterium]|nr:hypothetical protein [Polyangiales bacterium]